MLGRALAPSHGPVAVDGDSQGRQGVGTTGEAIRDKTRLAVTGQAEPAGPGRPRPGPTPPAGDRGPGRHPNVGSEQRVRILAMLEEGYTIVEVARALDVHRGTVGRISAARRRGRDTAAE